MHIKNFRDQCDYHYCISKLLFHSRTVGVCPLCPKAAAWVVMGRIYCFSGAGTTWPLAERISLKSSDFDDVRLSRNVPTHSPPNYFSCICLSSSLLCLPAFHMLSLSLCLSPYHSQHLSLSLCLSHSLPHMVMLFLAKPACWLIRVGVFVCVSLACSL